jgi:anti-anti-sigma factor
VALTTSEDGSQLTMLVDGAIDSVLGAEMLKVATAALTTGKRRFLVNLQRAKQANSAGLQALVTTGALVTGNGGRLALVNPGPVLADILRATRLDRRFAVFESTEQAISGLRREGR